MHSALTVTLRPQLPRERQMGLIKSNASDKLQAGGMFTCLDNLGGPKSAALIESA